MHNVKKNIDNLLKKPMDRRRFLKHVGLGALLVVGLGPVLKMLLAGPANSSGLRPGSAANAGAYGAMTYGTKSGTSRPASARRQLIR